MHFRFHFMPIVPTAHVTHWAFKLVLAVRLLSALTDLSMSSRGFFLETCDMLASMV